MVNPGRNGRGNSFDLIRHIAALLVLFSHHFRLSGFDEPVLKGWDTLGFVSVATFFAISGYFMPKSFQSSGGFYEFIKKRCRRIFPGLFVCSFVMVYAVGLYFTEHDKIGYIFSYKNISYVFGNSIFIFNTIPGVFSDFIFKDTINGSLWTLPMEFLCYLIIGSLFSLKFCWKIPMCLLWLSCMAVATVNSVWSSFSFYGVDARFLSIFGISFATGALMSMTQDIWSRNKITIFIISIIIIWQTRGNNSIFVLGTVALAAIIIIIGTSFRENIINGKFDISYGIYIYAFPTQQIIINKVTGNFWVGMALSILITIILSVVSYKYVESPLLKHKGNSHRLHADNTVS